MYEWNDVVQRMIDFIEENLEEPPSLLDLSKRTGYSPYYCSTKFHEIAGMTLKTYLAGRRLARAALALRDGDERIIDIAVRYGYSSQEALTRAFVGTYGCTPAVFRKRPVPIPLLPSKEVFHPYHYEKLYQGGTIMSEACLTAPQVTTEFIPAHKYIGIWEKRARHYGEFWDHHDCDTVCGIIESMQNVSDPIVGCHMAGYFDAEGEKRYFYGLGVPLDYSGEVPEGFELREFPASYYLKFFHPRFDFLKDNAEVMRRVEDMGWSFDLSTGPYAARGYAWNEDVCQIYHRHYPEVVGYEFLRPVRILGER